MQSSISAPIYIRMENFLVEYDMIHVYNVVHQKSISAKSVKINVTHKIKKNII
jgi:hypothetical protein